MAGCASYRGKARSLSLFLNYSRHQCEFQVEELFTRELGIHLDV